MANKKQKEGLVVGLFPNQYKIADYRLNKPVCLQEIEKGTVKGSMLLQDIDSVIVEKRKATYFCPNNIAILLSISSKSIESAKKLYNSYFKDSSNNIELEKADGDRKAFVNDVSKTVCDYIEHVQSALVFGYTALETFANLSIPDDYKYEQKNTSKGITETYDKQAIERWINLKVKFQYILRGIYQTKKLESQKWWGHFSNLEKYRNDIIHQKSIDSTSFYKDYFKTNIFSICESPLTIIKFFYAEHSEENRTNPVWPWLVNEENCFPISTKYKSENFEITGNIHEGKSK